MMDQSCFCAECERLARELAEANASADSEHAKLVEMADKLHETRAQLEATEAVALNAKLALRTGAVCTPAERAVLDACVKWRLSWEDHDAHPSEEDLPEEFALYQAIGSMMAEPQVRDFEAELARRGEKP